MTDFTDYQYLKSQARSHQTVWTTHRPDGEHVPSQDPLTAPGSSVSDRLLHPLRYVSNRETLYWPSFAELQTGQGSAIISSLAAMFLFHTSRQHSAGDASQSAAVIGWSRSELWETLIHYDYVRKPLTVQVGADNLTKKLSGGADYPVVWGQH